jgi:hypothetical protein
MDSPAPTAEGAMSQHHPSPQQGRQHFLTVFLTVGALLFFLLVLILISGGFFLYVVLLAGAILVVGLLHYVLWGRAFSEEVAGEREEEQLRQRAQAEDWAVPDRRNIRRS